MSKRKRNHAHSSKRHHKKHHFLYGLAGDHAAEHPVVLTAVETGKDLIIGVVGGGLAGAAIGKSSLLAGILVTGAGHYMKNRYVQLIGIGMMASNGFQSSSSTTNGLDGIDGIKDRLLAYKNSFSEKFYLDKFLKKKSVTAATDGFGDIQYFTYPDPLNGDMEALNDIEQQLAESALQFKGQMGDMPEMTGTLPDRSDDVTGISGDMDATINGDMDERLY